MQAIPGFPTTRTELLALLYKIIYPVGNFDCRHNNATIAQQPLNIIVKDLQPHLGRLFVHSRFQRTALQHNVFSSFICRILFGGHMLDWPSNLVLVKYRAELLVTSYQQRLESQVKNLYRLRSLLRFSGHRGGGLPLIGQNPETYAA